MRMPSAAPDVRICTVLPDPDGQDAGRETITLVPAPSVSLDGWVVRSNLDRTFPLSGTLTVGTERTFAVTNDEIRLNNDGGTVTLVNAAGTVVHTVSYEKSQVKEGATISFPNPNAPGKLPVAVQISGLLVDPVGKDRGNETVTVKALAIPPVDMSGWTLTNKAGTAVPLNGVLRPSSKLTVTLSKAKAMLNNKGDTLTLKDPAGAAVHVVSYKQKDVQSGVLIDFPASDAPIKAPTPGKPRLPTVMIASLLPDPIGPDHGKEKATFKARGGAVDLAGWRICNRTGAEAGLKGAIAENSELTLTIPKGKACLHNDGDVVSLVDPSGTVVHTVEYTKADVREGIFIDFGMYDLSANGAYARVPDVSIVAVLPNPDGENRGRETITLAAGSRFDVDVTGWTLSDRNGKKGKLKGRIKAGTERAFLTGPVWMHNDGDVLTLTTAEGVVVDKARYEKKDVLSGVMIDFSSAEKGKKIAVPRLPTVQICSMMPNPDGDEDGYEFLVLKARGGSTSLVGWTLIDSAERKFPLKGDIKDGQDLSVFMTNRAFGLSRKGDTIRLLNADGKAVSVMSYAKEEVHRGVLIDYGTAKENTLVGKARLPTVMIARLLPNSGADDAVNDSITITSRGGKASLAGWKIKNKAGEVYKLTGTVEDEKTFRTAPSLSLSGEGDLVSLIDNEGREVHRVFYGKGDVEPGKALMF